MNFYLSTKEENITASTVLYMRRTGAYGKENHILMNRFKEWLIAHNLYGADTVIFAIPLDNPITTEAHKCRYDVCIICSANEIVHSDQVKIRDIDGGKYVAFLIKHTAEAVQIAWTKCFDELAKLGYTLDDSRPVMERYVKSLVDNHYCEICVPIL